MALMGAPAHEALGTAYMVRWDAPIKEATRAVGNSEARECIRHAAACRGSAFVPVQDHGTSTSASA